MTKKIIDLFIDIALPFKDNEGGAKAYTIAEILKDYKREYIPGQGMIINKQENPRIVLVSHMDLIKKFHNGFSQENRRICSFEKDSKDRDLIVGALDNTITNSIAILTFLKLIENGISDIELFLSEGEEVGFNGMTDYLENNKDKSKNTFFINLDVTNEGYGKDYSLEYDSPNFEILKDIQDILKDKNGFVTGDRVCDDTDAILKKNCAGFSFCLPTLKTIHSWKNQALIESLEPYMDSLYLILKNLNLSEDKFKNFDSDYIKLALKTNSLKKLHKKIKKKEKKEREKYKSYLSSFSSNYSSNSYDTRRKFNRTRSLFGDIPDSNEDLIGFDESPFDYEIEVEDLEEESELEIFSRKLVDLLVLNNIDSDLILSFFMERVIKMEGFSYQDLLYVTTNKDISDYIINILERENFISIMTEDFFIFNFR
jgi:hypothetical protein